MQDGSVDLHLREEGAGDLFIASPEPAGNEKRLRYRLRLLCETQMSKIQQRFCKPISEKGRIEPILKYSWEAKCLKKKKG